MTPVLAALALVLVLGLAAELAARSWIARRSRFAVWPPGMRVEVRQNLFPELEPRFRFEVNGDGERGGDARAQEDGVFRILTVGGSSVECFALDQTTSWPGQLELLLNRRDALDVLGARRVHVGNIGHSGVGAAELEMILERVLPNYQRLDAIVVMVGASTAYHWLEEGAPPAGAPPVVPEDALFARRPGAQPFGWKPGATALVELIRRARQALFRPVEVRENAGGWQIAARKMRAQATEIRTALPDPSGVLQHFEHHFRRALRHAMARSRRVLVLRQPWFEKQYTAEEQAHFWHGGIGRPWKEQVSVYFSLDVINRILSLIDGRVVAVADELGLEHRNLRPLLNEGLRHYYDHDHFTPGGAAVVARAVASALTGQDQSQRPGSSVETPVRRLTQPRVPLAAR
ncbi:MAG: hypothetical protein DMD62_13590 [Gemmatimonadetes bacterium]|nr:MAG: hypothetical protein DMD62_13590 [Gemmatimonadota bacterium]